MLAAVIKTVTMLLLLGKTFSRVSRCLPNNQKHILIWFLNELFMVNFNQNIKDILLINCLLTLNDDSKSRTSSFPRESLGWNCFLNNICLCSRHIPYAGNSVISQHQTDIYILPKSRREHHKLLHCLHPFPHSHAHLSFLLPRTWSWCLHLQMQRSVIF